MRILIYEYITSGGLSAEAARYLESLQREGDAMVTALVADFAALPGVQVVAMRDNRLSQLPLPVQTHTIVSAEQEAETFQRLASDVDWTVLVAPEIDGILLHKAQLLESGGGRLLSPSPAVIELCTDKRVTKEHLQAASVPVPDSVPLQADGNSFVDFPRDFSYPAVVKRVDGAGSVGMCRVDNCDQRVKLDEGQWMLESFVPGMPASVAVLCGPGACVCLPVFTQHLDAPGFSYRGGERLGNERLRSRAEHWARLATTVLPAPVGYVGIDLVLGDDPTGAQDAVIEINPRLTTSYVGLRAIASTNLAESMLDIATGGNLRPHFTHREVRFTVDGTITVADSTSIP